MKIAAVGFCCVDDYANVNIHYPTGNGVDCVINMAKMGVEASVVSAVGTDAYGKEMFEVLGRYGIDTSHLHVMEGKTSFMEMMLNGNDRVHVKNHLNVMADFEVTEEDKAFIKTHEFIHTDYDGKIIDLLPEFRKAGCRVVFDFSNRYLKRDETDFVLHNIDYALMSYTERDGFIEDYLKKAHEKGVRIAVSTLGEHGSLAYDGNRFYERKADPVKVVNTVGAGDAYCAGFMYGVMKGMDIPACMEIGAKTAEKIIGQFNPY